MYDDSSIGYRDLISRPGSAIELRTIQPERAEGSSQALSPPQESGKAHYYSQLSVMLFEKAASEDAEFPVDLDRVHTWFTTELTDAQRLVCLHDLLSMVTPSQHRFLFTSVAFDTQTHEDETVWLDLALSEAQKTQLHGTSLAASSGTVDDRLSRLDLSSGALLGENLFSGLQVSSSTSSRMSSGSSSISGRFSSSHESTRSLSPVSASSKTSSSKVLSILKVDEESDGVIDQPVPKIGMTPTSASVQLRESTSLTPSNQDRRHQQDSLSSALVGKAPPGFLSPTASEFRPSEPCCFPDVFMTDFVQWLRLLRLHKYQEALQPVHERGAELMLRMSDEKLEEAGVAALGARRKFLRLFERIREELKLPEE